MQQVLDVVSDPAGAVGPEVRQVLADLGRVDAGQLGQPLRGDRADLLVGRLEQGPVVEREADDRRLRDAARIGHLRQRTDFVHVFSKYACRTLDAVVVGLAFVAVVVSSLFAQAMLVRYTAGHQPQHRAWAIALAMFALASVALATGTSTGWDNGTFRVFYLLGAVVNVPWLAMGTVYLLVAARTARRVLWGLVLFSGFAAGVLLSAPMETVHGTAIPVGKDVFGALPADPGRRRRAAWPRS